MISYDVMESYSASLQHTYVTETYQKPVPYLTELVRLSESVMWNADEQAMSAVKTYGCAAEAPSQYTRD